MNAVQVSYSRHGSATETMMNVGGLQQLCLRRQWAEGLEGLWTVDLHVRRMLAAPPELVRSARKAVNPWRPSLRVMV